MIELAAEQAASGLPPETLAASSAVAQQVAASEWIGPLAPIALSPFFGLATLSGVATYGPEWLQERSAIFGSESALNNPILFWTMALLAIATSLPRLTKVSKPIALAAENIESYSAIIILVVIRFLNAGGAPTGLDESTATEASVALALVPPMQAAGIASLPLDAAMSLFAALNILVINGVKLFFEFLVWLIPFPTVDAMLEAGNKAVCAMLMGLYMYSPLMASLLNLVLLAICLVIFGWCYRRLNYYREIIAGPILAWLIPSWFGQKGDFITAFCDGTVGNLPSYTRVTISRHGERNYRVHGRSYWRRLNVDLGPCKVQREPGLISRKITLIGPDELPMAFTHRRWVESDECYSPIDEAGGTVVAHTT